MTTTTTTMAVLDPAEKIGILFFFIIGLAVPICAWLCVACGKGRVSAWSASDGGPVPRMAQPSIEGGEPFGEESPSLRRNLSSKFQRQLEGWPCFVWVLAVFIVVMMLLAGPIVVGLSFVTAAVIIFCAWCRFGRDNGVQLGMLALFFLQGGFLSCCCAMILEVLQGDFWHTSENSMGCLVTVNNTTVSHMTPPCNAEAAAQNLLSPGLIEETFKAIWLFWRLRRTPKELPDKCCACLPAQHSTDCGCWFKLAPTAYHVFLCSLALGAGFETVENVEYGLGNGAGTSVVRMFTSGMHMAWTGLIGLGLARRMFLPPDRQPQLWQVIMPSILLHGAFDYSLSSVSSASFDGMTTLTIVFFVLFLFVWIGSCCIIFCFTRCCAPGFWERRYPPQANAAPLAQCDYVAFPVTR